MMNRATFAGCNVSISYIQMYSGGAQESAMCACGHITQSVQHVVVDCIIPKVPGGFAGLCRPDAATRTWLKELNVDI